MMARLKFAIVLALMLAGLGALLAASGWYLRDAARSGQAVAQSQRNQAQERLARASDEAREIADLLPRYRALAGSALLASAQREASPAGGGTGDERRLAWVDHVVRTREDLALDGFKFLLEPQRSGDPLFDAAPLVVQSSRMMLEFTPLHEAEFLASLARLTTPEGKTAIAQVRDCSLARNLQGGAVLQIAADPRSAVPATAADAGRTNVPLLTARCNIEWLTLAQPVAETEGANAEQTASGAEAKK